jgi:hypothetical protein
MWTPRENSVILSDREMEIEFLKHCMPEVLKNCDQKREDRPRFRESVNWNHFREFRIRYFSKTGSPIAIISYWKAPDGEECRFIHEFSAPDGTVFRRKRKE